MKGRYIALEGIEGSGKSTIAEILAESLSSTGLDVSVVREPGATPVGERIRSVLLDGEAELGSWTEALLFAASRAQLARDVIGPALSEGKWIIGDRSIYSSLAYQGGGRRLGVAEVRSLNEPGLIGVWPDLVALLRVDPETGLGRQKVRDRIGAEGDKFQSVVAATFDWLAVKEPNRFVVADALLPVEDVAALIVREIDRRWPNP